MDEIILYDIDCFFNSIEHGKDYRFRLRKGMMLQGILANIQKIRDGREEFMKHLNQSFQLYTHHFRYPPVLQMPISGRKGIRQYKNVQHQSDFTKNLSLFL